MQLDRLLAMHHPGEVDPAARQEPGVAGRHGQHRRQGRDRLQSVLVDERELVEIQGIGAQADAQGVEHGVPVLPRQGLGFAREIQDGGIGDGHGATLLAAL